MKRKFVFIITVMMMVFSIIGCGGGNAGSNTDAPAKEEASAKVPVESSADLLNKVWDSFGEDQKFSAMGGDFANPVDGAAGIFNIEDTENLTYMLYIPADSIPLIDEAASLVHAMNLNTFTGAAFHLADVANTDALVAALKDNILKAQWMCGFPDKLVIFTVNGEYVVSAFGNEEIMENFKTKLLEVYGDAATVVEEGNIAQ